MQNDVSLTSSQSAQDLLADHANMDWSTTSTRSTGTMHTTWRAK